MTMAIDLTDLLEQIFQHHQTRLPYRFKIINVPTIPYLPIILQDHV